MVAEPSHDLMVARMSTSTLFTVCARIKTGSSFHELVTAPFACGINALCWLRTLPGDLREVEVVIALLQPVDFHASDE